ncbi:peptidoglycan recognition family protein [Anaerovibrio sp.]|uniref:peptidoglycan recognition protein family protein n=1 Tax=Anaerovibrio sp. TaxID=1872532 RepID=UPI0025D290B2|nr:peptidoglycan recognition family protein [Anaerovibrio sp.]
MDRRSFIKKMLGLIIGTGVLYLPAFDIKTFAASKWRRDDLRIRENKFLFAEVPEKRIETNRIIVHHTGTTTNRDMSAAEIHKLHRDSFGWAGIGYHYVIRKNGIIERGRGWNMVGAHAQYNNDDSVGIALAGNFCIGTPTPAQIKSLTDLLVSLCGIYGLLPDELSILGHRDVNATSCPGDMLYDMLPQIRKRVMKRMGLDLPED